MSYGLASRKFEHGVVLYRGDADWVEAVSAWILEGLHQGLRAAAIVTDEHHRLLNQALVARGLDLDVAVNNGRYQQLDAASTTATLVTDGLLDETAFDAAARRIIRPTDPAADDADAGVSGIRIVGETGVPLLAAAAESAAPELERLCTELASGERGSAGVRVDLRCLYPLEALLGADLHLVSELLGAHNRVQHARTPAHWDPLPPHTDSPRLEMFVGVADSVRTVRRLVTDSLAPTQDRDVVFDCVLVASELATNAVLHAGGAPFRVGLSVPAGRVRIAIEDSVMAPPALGSPASTDERGRGVGIVDALADQWGFESASHGKVVWAEVLTA